VQLGHQQLRQITPAMLRGMLDASGIKNRVIVVSACYAGGFIDKLKDDNTLIVAAAAPDRNSFGCSNENDWTYFGKAYFDEGLRQTTSFTRAFEIAKPLIEERERREKYDPSNLFRELTDERFPRLADPGGALRDEIGRFFPNLLVPAQPANRTRGSWAFTYALDQYFWQPDGDPKRRQAK
jgi:hypothetical protein